MVSGVIEAFAEQREVTTTAGGLAFHRFAAWAIVVVLVATTAAGLVGDFFDETSEAYPTLGWAAWWASVAAAVACWWDSRARWRVACIYTVGLVAVGMYLDGLNLRPPLFEWAVALAFAAYSLVDEFALEPARRDRATLARLAVPAVRGAAGRAQRWLVAVKGFCVCGARAGGLDGSDDAGVSAPDDRGVRGWGRGVGDRAAWRAVRCGRRCSICRWCLACCSRWRLVGRGCRPRCRRRGCIGSWWRLWRSAATMVVYGCGL